MPEPGESERNWGFVEKTGQQTEEVEGQLEREQYGAKTSGKAGKY